MNKKIVKNLFQNVSFALSFMIIIAPTVAMFFMKRSVNPTKNDIIYPLLIALLVVLYFGIGFYWIFQTVEISADGIEIALLKKSIKKYKWEEITDIKRSNIMRNPAITITFTGGDVLNLDYRKKIISALHYSGTDRIKEILDPLCEKQ